MAPKVLESTDTEGQPFKTLGPVAQVLLIDHQGGTWTLQIKPPEGDWQDTDITWTTNGIQSFDSQDQWPYRLKGGTVGAIAWFTDYWAGRR